MKKTSAVPGKPLVMKTREDEEQLVMDWVNMQSTYSDSIRYLIQKEIAENGLRNLQEFIPQFRTIESLRVQLANAPALVPAVPNATDQHASRSPAPPISITTIREADPSISATAPDRILNSEGQSVRTEQAVLEETAKQGTAIGKKDPTGVTVAGTVSNANDQFQQNENNDDQPSSSNEPTPKRPAGKKFGADVTKSFAN